MNSKPARSVAEFFQSVVWIFATLIMNVAEFIRSIFQRKKENPEASKEDEISILDVLTLTGFGLMIMLFLIIFVRKQEDENKGGDD